MTSELPDGNGLDLLAELENVSPKPLVVVMTGHGDKYSEVAIERGADDFLAKPFDASRLRVTVRNLAERFQLSQRLKQSHRRVDTPWPYVWSFCRHASGLHSNTVYRIK